MKNIIRHTCILVLKVEINENSNLIKESRREKEKLAMDFEGHGREQYCE